jgi:hypothetical protein
MKDRIVDENDENEQGEVKTQKPVSTTEKNPSAKATKPNKSTSNSLTLKQALQNVSLKILEKFILFIFSISHRSVPIN